MAHAVCHEPPLTVVSGSSSTAARCAQIGKGVQVTGVVHRSQLRSRRHPERQPAGFLVDARVGDSGDRGTQPGMAFGVAPPRFMVVLIGMGGEEEHVPSFSTSELGKGSQFSQCTLSQVAHTDPMASKASRDLGLRRISRTTRYLTVGALVAGGALSAAVAKAVPGRATHSAGPGQTTPSTAGSAGPGQPAPGRAGAGSAGSGSDWPARGGADGSGSGSASSGSGSAELGVGVGQLRLGRHAIQRQSARYHSLAEHPPGSAPTGLQPPGGVLRRIVTAATTSFAALGTTATLVVTEPDTQDEALDALRAELDAIDRAASRFRSDSELSRLNGAHGQAFAVSPLFLEALEAALRAAQLTQGRVDPTVGGAMRVIGYDRNFAAIGQGQPTVRIEMRPVPGWQAVRIDRPASLVQLPAGVELDLGATAKALCADRAAWPSRPPPTPACW